MIPNRYLKIGMSLTKLLIYSYYPLHSAPHTNLLLSVYSMVTACPWFLRPKNLESSLAPSLIPEPIYSKSHALYLQNISRILSIFTITFFHPCLIQHHLLLELYRAINPQQISLLLPLPLCQPFSI